MKLLFSLLSPPLPLDEGCVCSLVAENPPMFRWLVEDIYRQIQGEKGECVLSDKGAPIDMAKYAELYTQLTPFTCNRKTLLTRVYGAIEQEATDAEHFVKTRALAGEIERYLLELGEDYALTLDAEKITVTALLKLSGALIGNDQTDILGSMLEYMDCVSTLEREKVFIFVHLRSYFSDAELELFFSDTRRRKHRVLMLEGTEHPYLSEEKRVVIDTEMCEIVSCFSETY